MSNDFWIIYQRKGEVGDHEGEEKASVVGFPAMTSPGERRVHAAPLPLTRGLKASTSPPRTFINVSSTMTCVRARQRQTGIIPQEKISLTLFFCVYLPKPTNGSPLLNYTYAIERIKSYCMRFSFRNRLHRTPPRITKTEMQHSRSYSQGNQSSNNTNDSI